MTGEQEKPRVVSLAHRNALARLIRYCESTTAGDPSAIELGDELLDMLAAAAQRAKGYGSRRGAVVVVP